MTAPKQRTDAKRRLLEKYLRGEVARQNWEAPIEPRAPGAHAPLAPGQHLIWLSARMTASKPIYNAPITIHHHGRLDRDILERAFQELSRRHEILRTTFASVDGEVVQAIHDRLTIQIPFLDLSKLSADQAGQEAQRVAVADSRRLFDLSLGPLVRARLVQFEPEYYRIYLTVHHAILDGVSIYNVLLPELAAIYDAFAADVPLLLPEPRYQYSDFALWQKRMLDNHSVARQIEYWREQLAGELPDLRLPADRPPPAVHSYRGGTKRFAVPPDLTATLRTAAAAEGVSLYMFLLATFKTLLHRYSGQDDIMVGGVSGARRRPEFQKLMGNFSNFFVLRTHPRSDATFRQYLAQVKDSVLGALTNGDVPLDQVIREVQPRRESARKPFFQVTFSMEPLPAEGARPDWYVTQMDTFTGYTKFDLYFEIDERADGIYARFDYSAELFDAATIDRMTGHWLALLHAAIEDPSARLSGLAMISAEEEQRLRSAWNGASREIPSITVHGLIAGQTARTPDAIAVEAGSVRLTYRELDRQANDLAQRLRQSGVVAGTVVAFCLDRTVDMAIAPLAVLKAGGVCLPLDPEFPRARLARLMDDANPLVLLTSRSLAGRIPPSAAALMFCDENNGGNTGFDGSMADVTPDDLASIRYASASPGRWLGAGIQHRALVNLLLSLQREPGFAASDSLLAVAPLSFPGAEAELYLPLISGGRLVIATKDDTRDPLRLAERLRQSKCTVLQAPPAVWRGLLDSGWRGQPGLRALCGGESLSRDLAGQLGSRVAELWNLYGSAETAVWSTVHRVTPGTGPVPIGHPIDNAEVFVLDPSRGLAPIGVTGELYIGGAGVARAYPAGSQTAAEQFVPHPFAAGRVLYRTGELARWRPDAELEHLGRIDGKINIRGFLIEPREIEAALLEHRDVTAAAVRVWPDADGYPAIAAYVTGSPGTDLRPFLRQKLPDYMVPTHFANLDGLPIANGGMVDYDALPKPAVIREPVRRTARSETERRLITIWESALDVRQIGMEDNFFDLGGHSFQVAKLIRKVEVEFGVKLSMAALFEAPTIASLAELLENRSQIASLPRVANLQPAGALEPLFWVSGGPIVRALAARLGTQRPFLGVGLEHSENEDLAGRPFSEFAERILPLVRASQPHGPYYLGGWCSSGLLAYEIATQLIAAGEEVALVLMLDAPNPKHYFQIPQYRLLASKASHKMKLLMRAKLGDAVPFLWKRSGQFLKQLFAGAPENDNLFLQALNAAIVDYEPKPIRARVLDLQPVERPEIWNLRESWAPFIEQGSFEVRDVPGNHVTMFEDPHVAALAACIRNSLPGNVTEARRAG